MKPREDKKTGLQIMSILESDASFSDRNESCHVYLRNQTIN